MDNNDDKILDFIFDEFEDNEFEKSIDNNIKMKEDYQILSKIKSELNNNIFEKVSDKDLDNQRDILFDKISGLKKYTKNKPNKISLFHKIYPILKYAAVVVLTFYISTYNPFNTDNKREISSEKIYKPSDLSRNLQPINYENNYGNKNINKYKIENLSINRDADLLDIKFDVTAHKEIKGSHDDPEIINTLNNLLKYKKNPAVRLRTVRAIGKTDDKTFVKTLLNTLVNDKDVLIRRKAMKILSKRKFCKEIQQVFIRIIEKDTDQTIRIMALNYLEKNSSIKVEEVIGNLENDQNDYLRFKANNSQE